MAFALLCTGALAGAPDSPSTPEAQGQATAQAPAQPAPAQELPSWAPGPLLTRTADPQPGRVVARELGLTFTLPESWRAEDVAWRELDATEAQAINPSAEAAMVVEWVKAGGEPQPLLTLYRLPISDWKTAASVGKTGPGLVTFTSAEKGYVVVRPPQAKAPGRYATLRTAMEDAIGTLALYDAYHEEGASRPRFGTDFAGKLNDGSAIVLHLQDGGKLTLTFGKRQRTLNGRWMQGDAQVFVTLLDLGDKLDPTLLLHHDGKSLIAVKWDESLFGNIGVRLDPPQ